MRLARHWYRTGVVILFVSLYTLLAPFGFVAFAILAIFRPRSPGARAELLQSIVRRAFASMHHLLRVSSVIDFDPRSVTQLIPPGPCVVIANHPTLTDTTAILGSIPRLCTAVRRDLFHRRWLHPLLADAGHFDAGGRDPDSTRQLLETAVSRLGAGFRVLVFPEGTRSPKGGLRSLGRTAFEIACQAQVPVHALAIRETPEWLAPGDHLLAPPAALPVKRLVLLGVFRPEDFSSDSRKMRRYVEDQYKRLVLGQTLNQELLAGPTAELGTVT
jgi:1-acyl-sn-glycerol-3-phosphate acyltransferase